MRVVLISVLLLALPKPVERIIESVRVGEPLYYKNLWIYPIISTHRLTTRDYLTLDEAVKKGDLVVKEIGSGQVNVVRIKNRGKKPVFIMTGELITGAKQDRMIKEDILLPPHSGWLKVPVFCTERGRWVERTESFEAPKLTASGKVRQWARVTEDQGAVWGAVSETKRKLKVGGRTEALQDVYHDKGVKEKAEGYRKRLLKIPELSSRTIGVVAVVGDSILAVDIFSDHRLFSRLWEKLLNSYIVDALRYESEGRLTRKEVTEFIRSITDAGFEEEMTPGLGTLYHFSSPSLAGAALTHEGRIVHLDAFPKVDRIRAPSLRERRQLRLEE
ncbi:hypothetical protein DRP53_10175 [candidate division WOR-3 bacterium]|uniref:ARG and Rhodanese-Phosphatase-superfamily-associated domain-containing protein n=1 Tax=candidate division WOR-3 bacterium TaxID=2052148 RepID=A0A660SFB0_UNCW3|nr:MAG: hypothetical protein DRP53_10175 [candidate division WOR-3 bacterium]